VSFNDQVYRHRWDEVELARMGGVWKELVRGFFQPLVGEGARVLDVGCGFCHFLNHLRAKEKVGVDANPAAARFAAGDVVFHQSDDLSLKELPRQHFDCVFISNLLEHLDSGSQVVDLLRRVKEVLRPGGRVIILQPNFRLVGAAYFDFIDHRTILTEKSVEEALTITGFSLERRIIRFLPYTGKSRTPQHPFLVRLYLWARPLWLVMGKQSLFVARA
jgi:SAM-dependent methyltransferase